ncbi:NEAT domain-containing protein [Bacillus sp. A301a_S52]|nr:NEAT domain-containing protein [Bacillus sp. A301a_S52]
MNKTWRKLVSILSIWMILFASLLPSVAGATTDSSLLNGEYSIDFTVLKDGTEDGSVMDGYTEKPAKIIVTDDGISAEVTLTNSDWIKVFQTKVNDDFVDAEVISEDVDADTRVVRFPVEDLSEKLDAYTHVVIPMINYDNWYNVQFQFHTDSLTEVNVETPKEEPEAEIPTSPDEESEENDGTVPEDNDSIEEEPDHGEEVPAPEEDKEVEEPSVEVPEEEQDQDTALANGTYTMEFEALHATEERSSAMANYLGNPAKLIVEDGQSSLLLTVIEQPGQLITDLRFDIEDELVSGAVISEDEATLSRVVQFENVDLDTMVNAEVDMYVPAANYSNTQKFRLDFNLDSLTVVDDDQPEEEESSNDHDLEVGDYTVDFNVLKDGTTDISVMDGYTEKPAVVSVTNSGIYVELTLTSSDWITLFQTKQDGEFIDADVVSEDAAANTRVVKFPVTDLEASLDAYTHVVIPMLNYDNYYTVQLSFDKDSLTSIDETPEEPTTPEIIPPEIVTGENGKLSLAIRDRRNFTYDEGNNTYHIVHSDVSSFELSLDILASLDSNSYISFSIGNDVTAIFSIDNVLSEFNNEEQVIFGFEKIVDSNLNEEAVSNLYDFSVRAGDREMTEFADGVTLTFAVDTNKVAKWNDLYVVYVNDEGEKEEVIEPLSVDSSGSTVTANVSHFSTYGVFELSNEEDGENTPPSNGLDDGTYTIDFTVLKNNTNDVSVMDQYTDKPASLIVENGEQAIELTLNHSNWIETFQVNENGTYVDAEVIDIDTNNDKRTVRFDVDDLSQATSAYTHIVIPDINYDNDYEVQIAFDLSSITDSDGNVVTPTNPTPVIPTPVTPSTPNGPNQGVNIEEGLSDGEYTIDFTVLKNNTNDVSVMDDYTLKPARLSVEDGDTYVTVTLTHSDWIKVFQTSQNGTFTDAQVVGVDEASNTRDVRFLVSDLNELLDAYTEVYFEEPILYDGKYVVQFSFDVDSITPLGTGGLGNGETSTERLSFNPSGNTEDGLTFNRNPNDNGTASDGQEPNSKTSDPALIGLLIALIAGSGFWLIRKYRLGTL